MLIARKSHARVEKRNSRVSMKTFDFARGRTFYRRDRSWIASRGAKGGGDRWLVLDAVAGTPSPLADDRHSGRWCTRNIAKRSGGGYGGARMRKSNGYRPQDDGPGNR